MKNYKAEYEDGEFEVDWAKDDHEAFKIMGKYEKKHGYLFNVFEIDDNYDEIRTVF